MKKLRYAPVQHLISRREVLSTALSAGLATPISVLASLGEGGLLVSAATDRQGKHWAMCLDESGHLVSKIPLPARAHQVAKHPDSKQMAVIGRRPGQYIVIATIRSGKAIRKLEPEIGFHFYGHAIYTPDGRYLVTTENHIDSGQGYIFVRDSKNNYRIKDHFPSYGIGPHELRISRDQDTLIIANGGILTHPDKGRTKLNLETMTPSLAYVSMKSGKLLELAKLDEEFHQLSIRHLDVNAMDEVLIGMQYQGDNTDQVPLVASHKRGGKLALLSAPDETNYAMKHYCGSVCFDPSGQVAAISCPKGNLITFWDYSQQKYINSVLCKDGCGLASFKNKEFLITSGQGRLYRYNTSNHRLTRNPISINNEVSWDNHLLSV